MDNKRKREASPPPKSAELKKLHLESDSGLDSELWGEIIMFLRNSPRDLGVAAQVCKDWLPLVTKAKKEYIIKRSERQLARIPKKAREEEFSTEDSFVRRVNEVFSSAELSTIYQSMIRHKEEEIAEIQEDEEEEDEISDTSYRKFWGMMISFAKSEKDSEIFLSPKNYDLTPEEREKRKVELIKKEREMQKGKSKRGGLPHLPPDMPLPRQPRFGAQLNCRDIALFDFRCIFPLEGIFYFFFTLDSEDDETGHVIYYNGPLDVLVPREEYAEEDNEVAHCYLIEFNNKDHSKEDSDTEFYLLGEDSDDLAEGKPLFYHEFSEDFDQLFYAKLFISWQDLKDRKFGNLFGDVDCG